MIASSRHQVALEMRQNDFERIEEVGADAMDAVRRALAVIGRMTDPSVFPIQSQLEKICTDRSMLSQTSRIVVGDAMAALRALMEAEADGLAGAALDNLGRALTLSECVADLLAAERHVGFCRGIR